MTSTSTEPGPAAPAAGPVGEVDGLAPRRSRPAVPWPVAVPLAVVAGALLDAAFPAADVWWLAMPALAVAVLLGRGRGLGGAYGHGVLFGLGFLLPHLQWSGIYVGPLPWVALATAEALLLALAVPGFALAWRVADARGGRSAWLLPLLTSSAWVAAEALRARWPFGGFGWGRLGFSQADGPFLGVAALGGVPLLGAAVVAVATALLQVLLLGLARLPRGSRLAGPGRPGAVLVGAVVTLGLVAAGAVAGLAAARGTVQPGDGTARVAAVQGDVPRAGLDFNAQRRAVLDNHVAVTLDLAARIEAGEAEPVDLVLWPENASDIDPLRNADAAAEIARATDAVGVPVLLGGVLQGPGENITNAMLLWEPGTGFRTEEVGPADAAPADPSPDPHEAGFYVKQALAPFGEYIPYRDFFRRFSPFVDQVTDFAPGDRSVAIGMGPALVGPAICFEVVEDDVMRRQVLAGADLLAVPTNNATFGDTDENLQQLAMSRVRAVEHGRQLVHISNVGTSAVVDVDGSTGRRTATFEPDVLVDTVTLRTGTTPATAVGPVPELVLVAVALLLVLGHGVQSLRPGRSTRPVRPAPAATRPDAPEDPA
ncbi:apolipoprotein N-acyltransferase [Aquipuribacter sp. SD81]|uniref:apolipoprotein N-acyltransferase n=1 Tax=Aquipuribacter sp. SD81 TaxID=3127703 RepID=UPI00301AE382